MTRPKHSMTKPKYKKYAVNFILAEYDCDPVPMYDRLKDAKDPVKVLAATRCKVSNIFKHFDPDRIRELILELAQSLVALEAEDVAWDEKNPVKQLAVANLSIDIGQSLLKKERRKVRIMRNTLLELEPFNKKLVQETLKLCEDLPK